MGAVAETKLQELETHDRQSGIGAADAPVFVSARFRQEMLRWTALYWAAIYVLFTLRSFVRPHPYFLTQAGLRLIMMAIGFSLSILLLRILRRIDVSEWTRRIATLAALGLLADGAYMVINYTVFYVIPGLWQPEHGAAAKIGSYIVEFFWLFPGWIGLYVLIARRHASTAPASETPRLDSLWAGSRGRQLRIPLDSVECLEAEGDYVRVHADGRSHLVRSTMARMERTLDPRRFVRLHRGFIVAAPRLVSVARDADGKMTVTLATGRRLPVGRNYAKRVRELMRSEPLAEPEG
jgi:hypothetical protein